MLMTSTSCCRLLTASFLLLLAVNVSAQVTISTPLKIEAAKPRKEKFKGEVLAATRVTITVRSRKNYNVVQTFTYGGKLAAKVKKWFDDNKIFQHGDRVEIEYLAGTTKAIKINGKPGHRPGDETQR